MQVKLLVPFQQICPNTKTGGAIHFIRFPCCESSVAGTANEELLPLRRRLCSRRRGRLPVTGHLLLAPLSGQLLDAHPGRVPDAPYRARLGEVPSGFSFRQQQRELTYIENQTRDTYTFDFCLNIFFNDV